MSPDDALSRVRRALQPPRVAAEPPPWLRPAQTESWRRALAALRLHGVACVADPVGSGKTYIALAAARAWNGHAATTCLVPAALLDQWSAAAARVRVPVALHSHERASRGAVPAARSSLVIIDESHRFRTPDTRRYRTIAPWVVGSAVLLLSATPIVNRPADLLQQLLLGAPDDTLAPFGVPSLGALLHEARAHPALHRLVIMRRGSAGERPERTARALRPEGERIAARLARELDALVLSRAPDVAGLIRTSLLRALASSRPALRSALQRYRALLRHAAEAAAAGRPLTRRALRAAVGADEAQLVLWALFDAPDDDTDIELAPADLPALERLIGCTAAGPTDRKALRLAALLADERMTIVFVTHRATALHLRDLLMPRLGAQRVAWCTGSGAGIGRTRVARRHVLAAFDPSRTSQQGTAPCVLIATDVAAEGLDLQRAERIVHYDLPWTPMRLRQREGRALRLGSPHARVEVIRFRPPAAIERRLGATRLLRSKEAWPRRLGLGSRCRPPAGADIAELILATRSIRATGLRGRIIDSLVLWRSRATQAWAPVTFDPALLATSWRRTGSRGWAVAVPDASTTPRPAAGAGALHRSDADRALRSWLAAAMQARAAAGPAGGAPAVLVRRITALAEAAARRRDADALGAVERGFAFLGRGHTAGEAVLAGSLAPLGPRALAARLAELPDAPDERNAPWGTVLMVRFPECAPSCSTSTERSSTRSVSSSTAITTRFACTDIRRAPTRSGLQASALRCECNSRSGAASPRCSRR